jgi:hypothetical protein
LQSKAQPYNSLINPPPHIHKKYSYITANMPLSLYRLHFNIH